MIVIEKKRIKHIPVLHVVKQKKFSEELPLVVFLHGFTSTKERNMHYAYLLAERGFRVIMPDAIYHGKRAKDLPEKQLALKFWEIVITSIKELSIMREELAAERLINPSQIGVAGTSMGAIATLGALSEYDWIRTAASLMGNPAFGQFALWQMDQLEQQKISLNLSDEEVDRLLSQLEKYDLSAQPEKLDKRPLLFWHGKKDPIVPYHAAHDFYQQIRKNYLGNEDRLMFITDEQAGHNVTNKGVKSTVNWFEKHLAGIKVK
ncbi:esterase [Bacillus sp. REN3]|uniref:esterase n=1 Tax=Bacillus sp. REN3 TaxID=2802440 RepID=UPI001AEEED4E|nr:esterase [Bacillus sp. REN3]